MFSPPAISPPVTEAAVVESTNPKSLAAVDPEALEIENVLPAFALVTVVSVTTRFWPESEACSLPSLWLLICWMTSLRVESPLSCERLIVPRVPS